MPVEIIGAIIALGGVILSVAISYFTSQRQANVEVEKLRTDLHQAFSVKLFEKRLEHYPQLYTYLSDFKKALEYEVLSVERVQIFFENLQHWDSQYSIFFGSQPGKLVYALRKEVYRLTTFNLQELQAHFRDDTTRYTFSQQMVRVELALKTELGVYAYENPAEIRPLRRYTSYKGVSALNRQEPTPPAIKE